MNRVGYGKTHKLKGSMQMGINYPVLCEEMVPGDIARVSPEVFIQSVVPPVAQLTDNIKYKIEIAFVPTRLVDDSFVRNITTTKDGTVKGNFKTWSLKQIEQTYGSVRLGYQPRRVHDGAYAAYADVIPTAFKEVNVNGASAKHSPTGLSSFKRTQFKNANTGLSDFEYNEVWNFAVKSGVNTTSDKKVGTSTFFGQGSLFDWLGLEPNANIGVMGTDGTSDRFTFNTWAISAYYMINNFWHTKPEYEKYIAPYFDYVYPNRDNSENRTTLHRYETLEEEFGNGFEEPRWSGRCVNGLVIDNWVDDYFSKTTKTAQRGIAPTVPVSLNGYAPIKYSENTNVADILVNKNNFTPSSSNNGAVYVVDNNKTYVERAIFDVGSTNFANGHFVISDLRSALALQHFQEDTQDCYKWSDWLQKVYGIAPSDNTLDEPEFIGATSGILSSDAVVATASTSGADLGEIGGRLGTISVNNKMFTYCAKEHGILMAIMTIKPERNYQSGVNKMFMRKNYLDMYFKYLTGIGNQAISVQEVCAMADNTVNRNKNFGFTSRFEEFRHSKNRVVGKCRNDNIVLPILKNTTSGVTIDSYNTIRGARDSSAEVPYLNTFHPYAISDAYVSSNSAPVGSLNFSENNQNFLLCLPQLNDIFVDDTEEPFLTVLGFNMDFLSPISAFTQPGMSYV